MMLAAQFFMEIACINFLIKVVHHNYTFSLLEMIAQGIDMFCSSKIWIRGHTWRRQHT